MRARAGWLCRLFSNTNDRCSRPIIDCRTCDRLPLRRGRLRACGSLQCGFGDPLRDGLKRSVAAVAYPVRFEHGNLGIGRGPTFHDRAAALDLSSAVERGSVGRKLLQYTLEHLADTHRALHRNEGAMDAVTLSAPFIFDHKRTLHRIQIGIASW